MAYLSFDPWLQTENARFDYSSDSELDRVINDVHYSWKEWRKSEIKTRKELLNSVGKRLLEEKKDHALTITSEMGKVIAQSLAEVEKCATLCFYYAGNIEQFSNPEIRKSSASESIIFYEPQGIILGVMPWNFPYWQALRFIIPVLAGGNSILLKHASNVPLCAEKIQKLFTDSGFPDNVCRNIFAGYSQVESIISRPEVRGVSLTGSNNAGMKVAEYAGRSIKKCVLELGGSDPFIVFHDADLDSAADAAVFSRFQNCGQSCIAAKRLFVHRSVFEQFLEKFASRVKAIRTGDPYDNGTFVGPMISEKALKELDNQVLKSVSMGARIIEGGTRLDPDRPLYAPTIMVDIPESSPVIKEEVFGPVIPVMQFTDPGEVIGKANNSAFGLGSSVWTGNRETGLKVAAEIETGMVAINGFVRSDPALPFGGVKDSGYGRELSVEGFREFLNIKTVTIYK